MLCRADSLKTLTSNKATHTPVSYNHPKSSREPERTSRGLTLEEVLRDDASNTIG